MIDDKYKDFSPYDEGKDFEDAKKRLLDKREYLGVLAYLIAGNDLKGVSSLLESFIAGIEKVHNYSEFQEKVTGGFFIPTVVKNSTTGFSFSGAEKIDSNKGYLYISNHRDIILDCMLLDYGLLMNNKPLVEMAVGDNLMANQFVEDLFRINGGIIIRRELPIREKYLESIRVSEYFVNAVKNRHVSIWVAQKSGRSKDGIDNTQPAIIKMLYLSQKNQGVSFSDLIKSVNIVPVSISYQYDPNDINKGREETIKTEAGSYSKKRYEDIISMVRGLRREKGKIHIALGDVLSGDYQNADEVARVIDRQIHLNYRLFDTNYMAYDYLEHSERFKGEYSDKELKEFLSQYHHLAPKVREYVLNAYANPVRMKLKEEESV